MRRQRNMSKKKKKRWDKIIARALSKIEISNMSDREFKVMIIKTLTGLEKRVEDNSETLKKEIKKRTNQR